MLSVLFRSASEWSSTGHQAALLTLLHQVSLPLQGTTTTFPIVVAADIASAHVGQWSSISPQPSPASAADACSPSTSYPAPPPSATWSHHLHPLAASPAHQLQQTRGYRIPYRVILPKVPYSLRSGRPAPRPEPELEPIKGGAAPGELRWHRSVVRFPPEVSVQLLDEGGAEGRVLQLSGRAGTIRLSLKTLDPTGLLALRLISLPASAPPAAAGAAKAGGGIAPAAPGRSLLVLASPEKTRFEAAGVELNKAIRGVMTGYLLGLTVKGVGYRLEPLIDGEDVRRPTALNASQLLRRSRDPNGNGGAPKPHYFEGAITAEEQQAQSDITFPYNKPATAVRLKVGYSRAAIYPLPPHIRAFFIKPTLMYLYGIDLDELRRVAAEIRAIRKPNSYTGNGVLYTDEVVKLKQRAGAK